MLKIQNLLKTSLSKNISLLFLSLFLLAMSPLTKAAQNSVFVSANWVKKHQSSVKVIDLSDRANYLKFHLPNAMWVNYSWLIKPQNGLSLSGGDKYMANVFSQLGINNNDNIVIYDDMGGLNASRLYWEFTKLNHKQVHILDGGIVNWVLSGNKVTQKLPTQPKKVNYQVPVNTSTDALTANKAEVIAAIKDNKTALIDARSQEEYEGIAKQKRSGHIPSALWFDWSMAVNTTDGYKQQPKDKLLEKLRAKSINDLNQPIIVYCDTAHRASRTFTMLKSIGFNNIKLYDGSMQEYSIDKSLPLKLGSRP
ncbi:sulfurtransferase [Thiomicrorhabdus sp. Milos-T2]|uniref:sulfurtransferase n=1 Tax=Thiomicrorhabdus sp. Milos-T2 TaxID=90814 RepID=UPI000494BB49|nr:rhodanese-like domain-containing protein [Thiomicrorhabdus sp. Milos-T2]